MTQFVFMYHDVIQDQLSESGFNTSGANYYKTTSAIFESHISKISSLISIGKIQHDSVVLTFDDGGRSFYDVIAPILEKYGFIGHFYIATQYIGSPAFLSAKEIKELSDRGHIIGSHSVSHPSNIQRLSKEDIIKEWTDSINSLQTIVGRNITEVSIPNGYFDVNDVELLRELGVKTIYTSNLSDKVYINGINIIGRYSITKKTTQVEVQKMLTSRFYTTTIIFKQYTLELLKKKLGNNYIMLKKLIRKWL